MRWNFSYTCQVGSVLVRLHLLLQKHILENQIYYIAIILQSPCKCKKIKCRQGDMKISRMMRFSQHMVIDLLQ